MIYMICYDISSPRRLARVAGKLRNYGVRIQKSFFQCNIEADTLNRLRADLLAIIDRKRDSLYIYPICKSCSIKAIQEGKGDLLKIETFIII